MRTRSMRVTTALVAGTVVALAAAPPALADILPFGHACTPQNGVRFCPTTTLDQRVASWDGTPLDVDVTLPVTGDGGFPTIVILHGLGGDKSMFEDTSAEGSSALSYHYNNVYYAQRGYAVVNLTARGFGNSCGAASKDSAGCARGWPRLDDTRYEARDVQHLLGLLVDAGISAPGALGVTGVSYGGGTSAQLGFLKDRVQREDGSFAPWLSPQGTTLAIAASYPRWGWANLTTALVPNGRASDGAAPSYAQESSPVGVTKLSYTTFLYLISALVGNLAPPGMEPSADLTGWYARLIQGEPYTGAAINSMIAALAFKGTTGVPLNAPAPMLIENGWTDQLFPAQQGLALYNQARAASASADVTLQLADTGHMAASNRTELVQRLVDAGSAFFDAKLRNIGTAPAPASVRLYPMTCPAGAPSTAIVAPTWSAAHPGTLSFSTVFLQGTTSNGLDLLGQIDDDPLLPALVGTIGDVLVGVITGELDLGSITGGASFGALFTQALQNSDPCRLSLPSLPSNAISSLGALRTRPFTLVGMPRVTLDLSHTGSDGQLAARLWDVGPDGRMILVTRGVLRVASGQAGTVSFQLDGNAYTFAVGHRPRMDLVSTDSTYVRASNGLSTTFATRIAVDLPTAEARP